MSELDAVRLAFDPAGLALMNVILGTVMFGVALDLKLSDLRDVLRSPKAPLVGLASQVLVLPLLAWALGRVVAPTPSFGLGLILVASCPGGNVSNAFTHLARGDVATSVGMTAVSTLATLFTLPANVAFWGSRSADTAALLQEISPDPVELLRAVGLLVVLPAILGTATARWAPAVAARLRKPFRVGAILAFVAFVGLAFWKNREPFVALGAVAFPPVILLNSVALALGYGAAWAAGLPEAARRAVSIEVGIQNAGFGLVLVFTVFDGLGGMALVCAAWGLWHLVSGLGLALIWGQRPVVSLAPKS